MNLEIKPIKITIGLPSNGYVRAETAIALSSAISFTADTLFNIEAPVGTHIHQLREHIAKRALEVEADYLMFIDSDMVFPPDGITKLLSRDKEIIGADYHHKFLPKRSVTKVDPTKLKPDQMIDDPLWHGHKILALDNKPKELFEVRAVGTGFMLIKTEVFKKISPPWFWFDLKDNQMQGEDVWFCERAHEAGFSVWCDPTIPIEHIGVMRY